MNSRRRILQYLGLGSLLATAGTINQARAAKGMEPISPGYVADQGPHWVPRPTFGPYTRTKWQHRTVRLEFGESVTDAINRETADDETQFVSVSQFYGGTLLVFRKRVLWSA